MKLEFDTSVLKNEGKKEAEKLIEKVNKTSFHYDNNYIYLNGEGDVDLGGVAKGYALEKCKEYLKEEGCKYYLINAGQSSISFTSKKNDKIKCALSYEDMYYGYVETKNLDISTSGPEYQFKVVDLVPRDGTSKVKEIVISAHEYNFDEEAYAKWKKDKFKM